MKRNFIILASFILIAVQTFSANDGHSLWLNMKRNILPSAVVFDSKSLLTNSIAQTAADELRTYWKGDAVVLMLDSMNVEAD